MSSMNTKIWEDLGELEGDDAIHVLTKLFETYESQYTLKPDDVAGHTFFKNLDIAIGLTRDCNLNRR